MEGYNSFFGIARGRDEERSGTRGFFLRDIQGTAFPIGGRYFLTADHVIQQATAGDNQAVLAFYWEGSWRWSALKSESCPALDIAVVYAEVPKETYPLWSLAPSPILLDVYACGYPYAFDRESVLIHMRAFKGYIVNEAPVTEVPGRPSGYELSFAAPRGLSGSPLITFDGKSVIGVVIGNRTTEMTVFSNKETVQEPAKETIVERFEALNLGLAVGAADIVQVHFNLLGRTVREHLAAHGLLSS